jgi:hypothetical protein
MTACGRCCGFVENIGDLLCKELAFQKKMSLMQEARVIKKRKMVRINLPGAKQ